MSGIAITFFWLMFFQRKSFREASALLFSADAWLTKQALLDLACSIFMLLAMIRVISPLENWIYTALDETSELLPVSHFAALQLPSALESLLATTVVMLAYDFSSYATHRLMHHHKTLWRVHAFHHSAPNLNFFTTYRQHPLEPLILAAVRSFAAASSLVVFYWFFPAQSEVSTVMGLGSGFFIYMFTVNLRHSPVPVRYPRALRRILISPHVHHLHHSSDVRHLGKNYGVIFSFWDRWWGTYHEEDFEPGALKFAQEGRA
jgi:sterol desaturase/sphingolipid hydroxylase (fatty acid hydroxylase superfamily)